MRTRDSAHSKPDCARRKNRCLGNPSYVTRSFLEGASTRNVCTGKRKSLALLPFHLFASASLRRKTGEALENCGHGTAHTRKLVVRDAQNPTVPASLLKLKKRFLTRRASRSCFRNFPTGYHENRSHETEKKTWSRQAFLHSQVALPTATSQKLLSRPSFGLSSVENT